MRIQSDSNATTVAGETKLDHKFKEMGITTPPPLASRNIRIDIGSQKVDERFLFTSTQNRDIALAYLCSELRATNKTMLIYVWAQHEAERITKVLHKLGTATPALLRTDYPPAARAAALESPVLVTTDEAALLATTTPPLPPLPRVDYIINFDLLAGWWKNPPPAPAYARRFADAVFVPGGPCDGVITLQTMDDNPGVRLLGRPLRVRLDRYPVQEGKLEAFRAQFEGVGLDGLQPEPIPLCRQWFWDAIGWPSGECKGECWLCRS